MAGGRERGGILGLLDLIEEHRAAIAYDFRSRFHLSLAAIPDDVGWDEALDLISVLRRDPGTAVAAAMEGWDYGISREAVILADIFEMEQATAGVKRPQQHPLKPWRNKGQRNRMGNAGGRTPEAVRSLLSRARTGTV